MSTSVRAIVGSTNLVKLRAVESGILSLNPAFKAVEIVPLSYTPDIPWRSNYAIGQPFGKKQTAFGAIDRVRNCWDTYHKNKNRAPVIPTYMVALENGLVHPKEVGKSEKTDFDVFSQIVYRLKNYWDRCLNIFRNSSEKS